MISINEAIEIINKGGVVIFPTDTAFGIGCRIDNDSAIKRLFEIRRRPHNMPTPVLVDSPEMAKGFSEISPDVEEKLLTKYWPGGLTVIVPAKDEVPEILVKDGGVGLRQPNNEVALALIAGVGVPLLGPSANFHGEKTPYQISELNPELIDLVDGVVDGKTSLQRESTVISVINEWTILRQGAVVVEGVSKEVVVEIDSSSSHDSRVAFVINGKRIEYAKDVDFRKEQVTLPLIEKGLKENNLSVSDITGIKLNEGPGSFTGLRVGASIANTLAKVLNIPINNHERGKGVEPVYE